MQYETELFKNCSCSHCFGDGCIAFCEIYASNCNTISATKLVVKFKGDNSNRIINISRNEMDGILEYLKEKLKSNIKNAENEFESL